jgi:hypothetical protein
MQRAFFTLSSLLILLIAALPIRPLAAQVQPEQIPRLLIQPSSGGILPFSDSAKYPSIDAHAGSVYVGSNADRRYAAFWAKPDASTSLPIFGDRNIIGEASADPDWTTVSLTTADDGTIYMVWTEQDGENTRVLLRRRPPGAAWEPVRQVIGYENFHVNAEVGVSSDNVVFVLWRVPDQPVQARVSYNGGISWVSGTFEVGPQVALGAPQIATGPAGQVLVAYASADGRIFASQWSGSGFVSRQVSDGNVDPAPDFFGNSDPSVTIAPNGRAYVAWRTANAVLYAERRDDGSWPDSVLAVAEDGEVAGRVAITADEQNNLHVFWLARLATTFDLFYAYKMPAANWQGPFRTVSNGGLFFNADAAANISDRAFAHAVVERFAGADPPVVGYFLFDTPVVNLLKAHPLIENNAAATNRSTVDVRFSEVQGAPDSVRWRWQEPPTATVDDSGGWQPFRETLSIAVPAGLITPNCPVLTLYTQVRRSNQVQEGVGVDAIVLDTTVQALVSLRNPQIGDPGYTGNQQALLEVNAPAECSDPLAVSVLGETDTTGADKRLSQIITLPSAAPIAQNVVIGLRDHVGNALTVNRSIINDPIAPTFVTSGTLDVRPDPSATVLIDLLVNGTVVSDTTYPEPHAWGLEVAISTTLTTSLDLDWQPVPLPDRTEDMSPGNSLNFSLPWSLAGSLPDIEERICVSDCAYYVYVRFLDGAGNPTPAALVRGFELEEISFPRYYLPLVVR